MTVTHCTVGLRARAEHYPSENLAAVYLNIQKLHDSGKQPAADVPAHRFLLAALSAVSLPDIIRDESRDVIAHT